MSPRDLTSHDLPLDLEHDTSHDDERRDRRVRHAVSTALTDKQREAVELFFFEGLSQPEIARRLGVSQQVIDKRLHGATRDGRRIGGALAKLRVALAAFG